MYMCMRECVCTTVTHVYAHCTVCGVPTQLLHPQAWIPASRPPCSSVGGGVGVGEFGFEGGSSDSFPNNPPTLRVLYSPQTSPSLPLPLCPLAQIASTHTYTHTSLTEEKRFCFSKTGIVWTGLL